MNFFMVFIKSIFSIIALFILTEIMGKKQISQLNLYDYVVGITIGSVAAEISTNLESNFFYGMIVMIVYTFVSVLTSHLTAKSINLRRILAGTPIILMENGKIIENSLKKAKFDVNDLLREARVSGYFDLSEIELALMESNGRISFLPKSKFVPVTPNDMKIKVDKNGLVANLIIDGKVMKENLEYINKSEKWLLTRLKNNGYESLDDLLLVICDKKEKLTIYERNKELSEFSVLE